jgi:hypothetical protein
VKEQPSQQDARPMGNAPWRYGTQEEGCTNHSFIHSSTHQVPALKAEFVCHTQNAAYSCSKWHVSCLRFIMPYNRQAT